MAKGTTRIGVRQPELEVYTRIVTALVRKINESDLELTPKEQAVLVKKLTGLPNAERIALVNKIFTNGPDLHPSIEAVISKGRGRNKVP